MHRKATLLPTPRPRVTQDDPPTHKKVPLGNFLSFHLQLRLPSGIRHRLPGDASELSAPYYNLSFSQKINDRFSHEMALGSEATLSDESNFAKTDYINYGITSEVWEGGRLTVSGFAEALETSGIFFKDERYRAGVDVHLAQRICTNLTAAFSFHYGRDLAKPNQLFPPPANGLNYDNYVYGAMLDYGIGRGRSVRVGYSCFTVSNFSVSNVTAGVRIPF